MCENNKTAQNGRFIVYRQYNKNGNLFTKQINWFYKIDHLEVTEIRCYLS